MADPKITRIHVNVTVDDDLDVDLVINSPGDSAAKLDKAAVVINRILGKA